MSVETVEQALTAIARPGVVSVQIILNAFRLKPLDAALPAAADAGVGDHRPRAAGVGPAVRALHAPRRCSVADDHRTYNRHGDAFDVGETFSGVDYETGVAASHEFAALAEAHGLSAPAAALGFLAQLPGITTVIPGARTVAQARANAAAGSLAPLPPALSAGIADIYDRWFRDEIHARW